MRPFYYDNFLVEMNYKEAGLLRAAVEYAKWMNDDPKFQDYFEAYDKLYEELTVILQKIPF